MRVITLNLKRICLQLIVVVSGIIFTAIIITKSMHVIDVLSENKELPIYSVETQNKNVSLTFDCAWGAEDIPNILNTLESEKIKASFFIVGQWAEKYPDSVRMIAKRGHDIPNHSYSLLRMGTLNNKKISDEIFICSKKLEEISGKKVELFRAPYGDYTNNVVSIARESGLYSIQWDVDSLDWKSGISPKEILSCIQGKVGKGSILLFHNDTTHTASLLPEIIKCLKSRDYEFLPVSELILRENYYINFDGKQKELKSDS
jgi:peptidoglycan-N-acetylglucosamine deacetylase